MAKHIDDLSIIKHGPEVLNISFQVRKKTDKLNKSIEKQQAFCISWSHKLSTFSKHKNSLLLKNFVCFVLLGNLWFFKRYISKETIATDAEN